MNTEPKFAGFWIRFFAGFLDLLFLLPIFLIAVFLIIGNEFQEIAISNNLQTYSEINSTVNSPIINIIYYGMSIAYLAYFVSSKKQATFGKRILKIYVGKEDGSRVGPFNSIARSLSSLLTSATLGLGFIPVIFTKEKVSLHDFMCKTRVFHGKK